MELRRVSLALSFVGLAGAGVLAAAEGPQDRTAPPPQVVFLGAFKAV